MISSRYVDIIINKEDILIKGKSFIEMSFFISCLILFKLHKLLKSKKGGISMNHAKALGIKWIFIAIITFSLFGIFYNVSLTSLFSISVIVTGISYIVGDLLILPRVGNVFATLLDFGLSFILFALLSSVLIPTTMPIMLASLAGAFFSASIEPLFHAYMQEKVFIDEPEESSFPLSQFQAELSEESDPDIKSDQNHNGKK